ncbi:hypothetical protein LWI29_024945 [Acer saccharum]|uniref:Retrotransposon gag domain-containing protein n=1 Tax=Acer saccharum TaxID=4024 RepID=A0AA39T5K0_ACESA|nr:hypothetical protein LWI29_024945 [Acer saccharum]
MDRLSRDGLQGDGLFEGSENQSGCKQIKGVCCSLLEIPEKQACTDYEQRLYVQLHNCKQGNRIVEEYIDEFIRLNSRNLLSDNENMQITRFRGGLKREIQDQMKMLNTFTLGQAFDLARKAEEPTRALPMRTRFTNQQFQAGPSRITTPNEPAVEASGAESRPKKCHQPRHRSNQCPQRPAVNFVEGDYAEDEGDCHETEIVDGIEEDGEDDFVGMVERQPSVTKTKNAEEIDLKNSSWDRGSLEVKGNARTTGNTGTYEEKLSCIVQRIFLTPKRGPDTSTRHQVFRTNALINGVIAKTVIDTGNSENLVSKELVKRLKLPTEKHSQPYGLRWIRNVEGATETVNEGKSNTYEFWWKGRQIILQPPTLKSDTL